MEFEKNIELKKIFKQEIINNNLNDIISYFKKDKCGSNILKGINVKNLLGYGVYGLVFKVHLKDFILAIKIFPFNTNYNLNELIIYEELYDIFTKHKFNHIPILFDLFICKNKSKLNKIISYLIDENLLNRSKYYCIIFSEYCKEGSLKKFMEKNNSEFHFRIFLLQFFTIMYFLENYYSNFLHNDLHVENILVRKLQRKKKYEYKINNIIISYECDFELLLNDFGMGTTKLLEKNITTKNFKRDSRYDVYKFINTFYNKMNIKYKSIEKFINFLCHENILKNKISYNGVDIVKSFSLQFQIEQINEIYPFINIPSVKEILKHKFFKEFVNEKISF